jgi:hypothetical protein
MKFDFNAALEKLKNTDYKKLAKDFVYGKPHGERRLGDLYEPKTGLYKHREWRGIKDTMYYFNNIWLYNYGMIVADIIKYSKGDLPAVLKGLWRYRWMGQTYLTVMHWFDRGLEGMRGEGLRASAWHYRGIATGAIRQFCTMFRADGNLHGGKHNDAWHHSIAMNETVWGGLFYPWADKYTNVALEMIPYFLTAHCNNHVVLNYIDAAQGIGVPGDNCPMCQAEAGIFILDDVPDYAPFMISVNEACDDSVATTIIQDWLFQGPLCSLGMPMRFSDPLVKQNCMNDIEKVWKFIEEQTGTAPNWDLMKEKLALQNANMRWEWEKWDVAANTNYYPINSVAQALYRIYTAQVGMYDIAPYIEGKVRKIMEKCVDEKINPYPMTRHRAIAWSCAPLYYSNWCTWAYNCWGINTIINMDSLMMDMEIRTDSYEHMLEDCAKYHMEAPMRRMAVGGMDHFLEVFEYMERFHCDMVVMYDQLQCKGAQSMHGIFEDEFRARNIHAIWMPHALPDKRVVPRAEIRRLFNDYMFTVMHEEPLDPSLLDFDDSESW